MLFVTVAKCLLGLVALHTANASASASTPNKPNFVFIMTDDQDLHLNSLDFQPAVQKHFGDQGTLFKKHFCTLSICCPSRVSLWTGMAGHNTNVTDVKPPYGGYPKFVSQGFNENYFPIWMQAAGYNTYYTGKLMNAHSTSNWNSPRPAGWNGSDFLIDPGTYIYNNCTMQRNEDPPQNYPGNYSTDLVASKALGFLDEAAAADAPFFLGVMPIGPHAETISSTFNPPVPAERHKDLYRGVKVPRTSSFNPEYPSGANYVKALARQNESTVAYNDEFYRLRLATLAAVDDLIDSVMDRLEEHGLLDNTYVFYTSDNGFHIGQHRLSPGKTCPYEEDVNIPLLVRGPGVAKGKEVNFPTSHTDLVPTMFNLAGIPLRDNFDGTPIPVRSDEQFKPKYEHVNIEFWGKNIGEGAFAVQGLTNNTYKTLRIVGEDYDIAYIVWCSNDHELYDMKTDPSQMTNLFATNTTISTFPVPKLTARLDALLMVTKSCKGQVCIRPWETLHPQGNVQTLKDAMALRFDGFYEQQPKVSFSKCALGYIIEYEGPQDAVTFSAGYEYLDGSHWSDWT